MKKLLSVILFFYIVGVNAQQLPYFTQVRVNTFLLNPGATGVKKEIDARLCYRNQWLGYDGNPVTEALSFNSRLMKGKMGVGLFLMRDVIGPIKKNIYSFSYAFHIKFPDSELSIGVSGNALQQTLMGSEIVTRNSIDKALDQKVNDRVTITDAGAGIYFYNDRFHIGASVLNMIGTKAEFYKADTTNKGIIKDRYHMFLTMGYNVSQNPDLIWEHNLLAGSVPGSPFILDYNLMVRINEKFLAGLSIRLKDAASAHLGFVFMEYFQAVYSYDFVINPTRPYSSGSHELTIAYVRNIKKNKRAETSQFSRQRYKYRF